jgi:AcrR family transcriptional regulator
MARAQERSRTPSTEVGDSLMTAALDLLEEAGPDGMTVRAVATRAGVAPMGVYSRFGGKPGLVEAVFVHGFHELHEAVSGARGADARSRLHRGCMAYREYAIAHPHLYGLMFRQMKELDLSEESINAAVACFQVLADRVADAMEAGALVADDSTEVAQRIWNGMHGGVELEIAGIAFTDDAEATFSAMIETMLRGLEA